MYVVVVRHMRQIRGQTVKHSCRASRSVRTNAAVADPATFHDPGFPDDNSYIVLIA